jgi:hypothetical protein
VKTSELHAHLRQTQGFIDADPELVVFQRPTLSSDGAGGRVQTTNPVEPAQRIRVVPARTRSTSLVYTLPNGILISSKDYMLVGMPDLDVKAKDLFEVFGQGYQVSFVNPDREVATLAQLDLLGKTFRST